MGEGGFLLLERVNLILDMKKFLVLFALCLTAFQAFAYDLLYKKFEPENPSPKPQENIDWSDFVAFNASDKKSPRVLLIGDSIVRGFQSDLQEELKKDGVNVSAWASSMCASDPDYIYALNLALEEGDFDIVGFHNGGHLHIPSWKERKAHIVNALNFVKAKAPSKKIFLMSRTPLKDSRKIDDAALYEISKEMDLPIVDFQSAMRGLDRNACWADDGVHFKPEGTKFQASIVAEIVRNLLRRGGISNSEGRLESPADFNLRMAFNAKSKEGRRIVLLGGELRHVSHRLREKFASVANFTYWDSSKGVSHSDYGRLVSYVLSLPPCDAVVFKPQPVQASGFKAWSESYVKTLDLISKKHKNAKLILATNEAGNPSTRGEILAQNKFIRKTAAERNLPLADFDNSKSQFEVMQDIICRVFNWSEDEKGGVVQLGSKYGPNGEIK